MDEVEEARKKEREKDRKREELRLKREEELKKKFIRTGAVITAIVLCVILGVVSAVRYSKTKTAAAAAEKKKQQEAALEKEQEENIIDFLAVGDNIAHLGIRESGMTESGDWNYDAIYQPVKEDVEAADLALVTQETVFVENREDISGYPSFGTPPEFGDALADTGTQELADQHTANERNPGEFSIQYYKDLFEQIKAKGNDDGI